ncbi:hypothetical protein FRC20_005117 [Serendipita sp. 405]|nr:hypothetical protein FRC20_005117 [Serendipita sp. 405]
MLPVLAVVMPAALWGEIVRVFRFIGRSRLIRRVQVKENTRAQRAQRVEKRRRNTVEQEREAKGKQEGATTTAAAAAVAGSGANGTGEKGKTG